MRKHSHKTPRRKTRKKARKKRYNGGFIWLSNKQMKKFVPLFPKSRGKPRVDDQRVLSGIAHVQQVSCHRQDAPAVYGPHKTLYSHWNRWSKNDWFRQTMRKMSSLSKKIQVIMIDSTYFKTPVQLPVCTVTCRKQIAETFKIHHCIKCFQNARRY